MTDHLKRICADYRTQLDAMLSAFETFPAGTKHTVPQGGLFVWAELPEGADSGVRRAITPEGRLNAAALTGALNGAMLSAGRRTPCG